MPHEEPSVHRDATVEALEVLPEALPVPVDPGFERDERHALHLRHHPTRVVGVARLQRGQREPAVAAEHRGHSVERRRCRVAIPVQLRVVVRVDVDEPGRDDEPRGVEGLRGQLARELADPDDAAVLHGDVGAPRRRAQAVDDESAGDEVIEHARPPKTVVVLNTFLVLVPPASSVRCEWHGLDLLL